MLGSAKRAANAHWMEDPTRSRQQHGSGRSASGRAVFSLRFHRLPAFAKGAAFRVPARLILPFCLISSTSGATETSAPTTPTSSVSGANEGHPNRPSSRHHSKDERTPISREDRRRTWGTQRQASTRVSFSCTRHPSANALSSLQLAPSLPFTLAVMF